MVCCLGANVQGSAAIDVAVEADGDGAIEHLAWSLLRRAAGRRHSRSPGRTRGRAAPRRRTARPCRRRGRQATAPESGRLRLDLVSLLMPAHCDERMGDIGAEPDHGDDEEQDGKRGAATQAMARTACVGDVGARLPHRVITRSRRAGWSSRPKPKPCSTRSAANNRNRYNTE